MTASDSPAGTADTARFVVTVDRNRCEGKAECVAVCPNDVFATSKIRAEDFAALGFFGKLKSRVHGGKTAYVVAPNACAGCGRCVKACPERAVRVSRKP